MHKQVVAIALLFFAAPAAARGGSDEERLRRLEAQVQALQQDLEQLRGGMAAAASSKPKEKRAVARVEADPAEEAYLAGYKLWEQRKFAEAQTALEKVAKSYPKHRRASYARNLAGRSYLEDGKPATAAQMFLLNSNSDPDGERAPDSLYYLGEALMKLNKPREACSVFNELQKRHGRELRDLLAEKVRSGRTRARCTSFGSLR